MKTFKRFFLLLAIMNSLIALQAAEETTCCCPIAPEDLTRYHNYFYYINTYPNILGPKGNHTQGEIELVDDIPTIQMIEEEAYQKALQKGFCEEDARKASQAGVIADDFYFLYVRDPVRFPSNATGLYSRLLWKHSLTAPSAGVAVLAITEDEKVLLNVNYRHALRSWEVELPGGLMEAGETPEETLKRELEEETGYKVLGDMNYLGSISTDHAVIAVTVPLYLARVAPSVERHPEATEALADHLMLSKEELENAILQGYIYTTYKGQRVKAYVRDSQLASALLLAILKDLF